MKLIKLTCPACAGALELPDNLTVAHCIYCGTKILLDEEGTLKERRELERYEELRQVASDAKNHDDVIKYCNLILEIDPRNVDAWINKAVSTFWLTTQANNRFDEAMEYLNKAAQLAPEDARINDTKSQLTESQASWYSYLGAEGIKSTTRIIQIAGDSAGYYESARAKALDESKDSAIKALNYYLVANRYAPDNVSILESIETIVKLYSNVDWSETVLDKVQILKKLRAKTTAMENLSGRRAELENAKSELAKLRTQKGFLVGAKIKSAESRVNQLQQIVSGLEEIAAYTPPKK